MDDQDTREPGDPRWEAVARRLAGEPTEEDGRDAAASLWLSANTEEREAIAALDRTLDRLSIPTPPDLDVEGALRKVKARRDVLPMPTRRSSTPSRLAWRAAAAVVVLVGGAAVLRSVRTDAPANGTSIANTTSAPRTTRLRDGSRVVLGPHSTLAIAKDFGRLSRELTLHGEAFFEVAHDTHHPFIVRTASATTQDVGTAFVVRDFGTGRTTVAVTDGTVLLRGVGAVTSVAGPGVYVRRGDRAIVTDGRTPAVTHDAGVSDDATAFTRGALVFHDAPMDEVTQGLRRWYGLEVKAADSSLAGRHLTATFHGESADEMLRVIALALGATVERRADTAIVRAKP